MPGNDKATAAQEKALRELQGFIGKDHIGGRTLCCLVGKQGSGKSWMAKCLLLLPGF